MAQGLKAWVAASGERGLSGHVVDPDDLDKRFVVELRLDGWPVRLTRANLLDPALAAQQVGDGCYGFRFTLDEDVIRAGGLAEVFLANSETRLGEPVPVVRGTANGSFDSEARWAGGLRFSGWTNESGRERSPLLRALIDGDVVAEARADRWTVLTEGEQVGPARAFELQLPERFADGRARLARIVDERGRDVPGSPCAFIAFADGLESFLRGRAELESELPRGALYDSLFPRSHPMRDYAGWRRRFPEPAPQLARRPKAAVALLGEGDLDASLQSLEQQRGADWVAAALSGASVFEIPTGALQAMLADDARGAEFVVFAPAGAIFDANAIARLAFGFARFPEARIVYADATYLDHDGGEWPLAFPAFDYERMIEQGYAALCFAARRDVVEAAAASGAKATFDLFFSALSLEKPDSSGPVAHAPGFVARLPGLDQAAASETLARAVADHFSARKAKVVVEPVFSARMPAVRVRRLFEEARVTTVVAARDDEEKVAAFLTGLFAAKAEGVQMEAIVVAMGAEGGPDLFDDVSGHGVRIARMSGPFRPERAFNMGAAIATSDIVFFASVDMAPLRSNWLEEMLGRLAEPSVGAVAPTLSWPSGLVQQSGLVVGPDFSVARAFADLADGELGYAETLAVARSAAAASALGMLTRRRIFNELDGFDVAHYPLRFAAADFGLRLRASGRRLVMAPRAKWSLERADEAPRDGAADLGDSARRELERFRACWAETLAADPLYNPQLALAGAPYSALAWPPRPLEPRLPEVKPPREWPAGA